MKWTMGLLFAALTMTSLFAQDEKDFPSWMKTVGGNMGATKKALEAKSADASASAARIADAFEKVHDFWKAKGAGDAQEMAASAKTAASDVSKHAQAGDFEKASQAFAALGGSCKGCHDTHREKAPDGSWKVK